MFALSAVCVMLGCNTQSPIMYLHTIDAKNDLGVQVVTPDEIEAELDRHSDRSPFKAEYKASERATWLEADDGGRRYGAIDGRLQLKLENFLTEHFRSFPIPDGYYHGVTSTESPDDRYKAYAYQLWDWFDDCCQIRFQVAGDVVSRELIAGLQGLLVGEFSNWCIVMLAPMSDNFDDIDGVEIAVFANSVLIPREFAVHYTGN
ncbi:hypothetical protein NZK35_34150 [Stieleria sp. ICT_E10.1]|nr:hypothetical protein [Stieleria sedimenti]